MPMQSILNRNNRAQAILREYGESVGEVDLETNIGDLLADMMHLSDTDSSLDFEALLDTACSHFDAEREG